MFTKILAGLVVALSLAAAGVVGFGRASDDGVNAAERFRPSCCTRVSMFAELSVLPVSDR